MLKNIVVIGTGSTAFNIYRFVEKYKLFNLLGFAVNREYHKSDFYEGFPVFCVENLDDVINKEKDYLFVAMQWNKLNSERRKLYEELKSKGFMFANIISPTSLIDGDVLGDNCWISDNVCIETSVKIHSNVYVKSCAWIGAGTEVSDHCFIAAKSIVAGGCKIGEQSFVGLGAIIIDDTCVGKKCIVGAGTVLKRNLPDFSVCKTSSDNTLTKQYTGDVIESKLEVRKNVR